MNHKTISPFSLQPLRFSSNMQMHNVSTSTRTHRIFVIIKCCVVEGRKTKFIYITHLQVHLYVYVFLYTHIKISNYINGHCPSSWAKLFFAKKEFQQIFWLHYVKRRKLEAKVNNRKNHFFLFPMEYLNSKYFSMSCFA